jgi:glycine dehydrogenase subunit 2
MHINLHKTFSTPHGGGGPGSGPVVFSKRLEKFCPTPLVQNDKGEYDLIENLNDKDLVNSFGRLNVFHGQMGMFVRAMSYMLSHGSDGLKQVSEDAVLNANYLRASLNDRLTPAFEGYCMHEILFSDDFLKDTGVETLDFAKAMIDEGYHPMTIYFPLVIHGALLVEPTETESKQSLDHFISTLRNLVDRLKEDSDSFKAAPVFTPIRRLDETQAARKPILRWKEEPLIAV